MSGATSEACADLERKPEVVSEERIKRKVATRRDSMAANRTKKAKKDKSSSDVAAAHSGKPKKDGKKRSRSKGAPSKKSIKTVRKQRRIQQTKDAEKAAREEASSRAHKSDLALDNDEGHIIAAAVGKEENAAAPEDFFWEVDAVIGRRKHRGRVEYLIRWKGCTEDGNTWEPTANLCDTASESLAIAFNVIVPR